MIQVRVQENHLLTLFSVTQHIAVCGCIHMTTSHNRRCWNTLYMYQIDLLWVWSGWGASIIIHSKIQVRNREKDLLPLFFWDPAYTYQVVVASMWPLTIWKMLKHIIWWRPDISMEWVGCLNQNLKYATSQSPREPPTATTEAVRPSIVRLGVNNMTTDHNRKCWNTLLMTALSTSNIIGMIVCMSNCETLLISCIKIEIIIASTTIFSEYLGLGR